MIVLMMNEEKGEVGEREKRQKDWGVNKDRDKPRVTWLPSKF